MPVMHIRDPHRRSYAYCGRLAVQIKAAQLLEVERYCPAFQHPPEPCLLEPEECQEKHTAHAIEDDGPICKWCRITRDSRQPGHWDTKGDE